MIRNFFYGMRVAIGVFAMSLLASSSSGALIDIDFNQAAGVSGTAMGAAKIGSTGDLWNAVSAAARAPSSVSPITSGPLFDTTGNTTGVTVSLGTHSAFDTGITGPGFSIAATDPALLDDYAAVATAGGTMTFSLNGLTNGGRYDLYVYSQNGGNGSSSIAQTFTVNGISQVVTNAGNVSGFINTTNYLLFPGIVATGGMLSGSVTESAGQASLNGFQLVPSAPTTLTTLNVDIGGQRNNSNNGTSPDVTPTTFSGIGPVGGGFISLNANSITTVGSASDLADGHTDGNADNLTLSGTNLGGTPISFKISGVGSDNNTNAVASNSATLFNDYTFINDGANNSNSSVPFTIGGLVAGTTANLYFYGNSTDVFTINGSHGVSGLAAGLISPYNNSNTTFFSNVLVASNDTISGTFSSASAALLSGFSVVGIPVPEPSSMTLAATGLLGLISTLRRRLRIVVGDGA